MVILSGDNWDDDWNNFLVPCTKVQVELQQLPWRRHQLNFTMVSASLLSFGMEVVYISPMLDTGLKFYAVPSQPTFEVKVNIIFVNNKKLPHEYTCTI